MHSFYYLDIYMSGTFRILRAHPKKSKMAHRNQILSSHCCRKSRELQNAGNISVGTHLQKNMK